MKEIKITNKASTQEMVSREKFYELYKNSPLPQNEQLAHLGLFIKRQSLSRILFIHDLYKMILNVPGIIIEFGVRWGQNLSLFTSLRGIYEPYNYSRKIVGFDTFTGFEGVSLNDGVSDIAHNGAYSVAESYEHYIDEILHYHESESPIPHIKKYQLIKGDANETINTFLNENKHTIISLAYFDFDIYKPTKTCLEAIMDRLTKGSILCFDELNHPDFPGETIALMETFGIKNVKLQRSNLVTFASYMVI
ncbi:MAG: crotonobetainyl-CoA--carnitine CoA-transferase [Nitrospinae bacterium]|nr:crotonobetainyl-CoA--carnitine CoA-transferase [Nitrospinota bacterium]